MEKFLLLIGKENMSNSSLQQMQNYLQQWLDWMKSMKERQTLILGEPVEAIGKQLAGKNKVANGNSFLKEPITGFMVIQADNFEEAV